MGTRSTIIQKLDNGKYRGIYCHWDGYLSHNGKLLFESYKDKEKVSKLLLLGSLSSLSENVEIPDNVVHNYDNPQKDITVAYHRDRGEEWEHTIYTDSDELKDAMNETYSYIFIEGHWYIDLSVLNEDDDFDQSIVSNILTIEGLELVRLDDLLK